MYYTDINECLISNGGCEFSCTNLEGINNRTGLGYQCGCDDGYQIAPNNLHCIGMYVPVNSYIRITNGFYNIHTYNTPLAKVCEYFDKKHLLPFVTWPAKINY